ncbi:hypothetical protein [Clostridium tyrobutyricum]|jgi:hypothetical protein|uniref:hypothetical protein n=1 Tax=Clostridium tyrobutyricum TaxID=1519 RepID=UPI00242B97B2|nr:hypothetical protein [Clostridium tyrobutyricum]
MEFTISEKEIKEAMENPIPLITYKGSVHINECAYKTACKLDIPLHGKHLTSRKYGNIDEVTCVDCLNLLKCTKNQ